MGPNWNRLDGMGLTVRDEVSRRPRKTPRATTDADNDVLGFVGPQGQLAMAA